MGRHWSIHGLPFQPCHGMVETPHGVDFSFLFFLDYTLWWGEQKHAVQLCTCLGNLDTLVHTRKLLQPLYTLQLTMLMPSSCSRQFIPKLCLCLSLYLQTYQWYKLTAACHEHRQLECVDWSQQFAYVAKVLLVRFLPYAQDRLSLFGSPISPSITPCLSQALHSTDTIVDDRSRTDQGPVLASQVVLRLQRLCHRCLIAIAMFANVCSHAPLAETSQCLHNLTLELSSMQQQLQQLQDVAAITMQKYMPCMRMSCCLHIQQRQVLAHRMPACICSQTLYSSSTLQM